MKPRIFYFNINYSCNNRCLYCFSHNTNGGGNNIDSSEVMKRIRDKKVSLNDIIVINGGEPTLHAEFYQIVNMLNGKAKIKIYSNGTMIDVEKLPNDIEFIIPIHGIEEDHNKITQNPKSYKQTICSLKALQSSSIKYSIKFIVNEDMIAKNFNVLDFLVKNNLTPSEVWMARLVETKVSITNNYTVPDINSVKQFISKTTNQLMGIYPIKYIDIAPCQIIDGAIVDMVDESESIFYFNDYNKNMIQTTYTKYLITNSDCENCLVKKHCDKIFTSYGVLEMQLDGKFKIVEE